MISARSRRNPAAALEESLSRGQDALGLGSLALLAAALFHRILFAGRILYERDVNAWFYPWAQVFTRILREGSWPLWNPYVAFGQPLLANPSYAVFYPPTWAIPLTSPWTYYAGFVVLHSLIGAAGIYALCRTLSLSAPAAFVASAVWMTSGPWLSFVNVGCHHMAGAAWMSVHLVAAERCFRAPSARRALVWGMVAGVQLIAGSADMAFMSAALVGGRLLARLAANRDGRTWRPLLGTSALASVVAVCLAAAQWIPAAELALRSARIALGDAAQTEWSVHPLFLLQAVVPVPLKDLRLSTYPWELVFQSRDPLLYSLYLGLPAAALVAAAMASRETPWRVYLITGLIVATLVALGHHTPVYGHLLGLVPPLRMLRFPMKVMVAVGLLWSVLAGAGFDQVRKAGERPARVARIVLASAVGVLLVIAIVLHVQPGLAAAWLDPEPGQPLPGALVPLRAQWIRSGGLALLLVLLLVLRRAGRRLPYTPLIALCVVADLFTMHVGLNDTAPRDVLSFRPPIVDVVSSPGRSRVYVFDYSLPSRIPAVVARAPHLLSAYDVAPAPGWLVAVGHRTYLFPTMLGTWGLEGSYDRDIQDFFPTHLATMSRLIRAAEGRPAQVRLLQAGAVGRVVAHHASGFPGLVPLASLPGLARAPILVFAVPDPMPRSYVAAAARVAEDGEAITTLLSEEFDLRGEVILAPTAARPRATRSMAAGTVGRSRIARWRPDRVTIEAEAEGPAFLVLVDAYDPGWRATVNGQPAPILRANVAFRAVALDAGSHVVEFVYRPASAAWGLGLSTITLLGVSLAAWRWRRPPGRRMVERPLARPYDRRPRAPE